MFYSIYVLITPDFSGSLVCTLLHVVIRITVAVSFDSVVTTSVPTKERRLTLTAEPLISIMNTALVVHDLTMTQNRT